jgi:hypothetical protein
MEPQLSEAVAHRKVVWLAQFWQTFFSITRSISGWCGHTRISRGVGMRMMDWCTTSTTMRYRETSTVSAYSGVG